jgi:hypothetical protein
MRFLLAATVIAALSAPAFAQQPHMQEYGQPDKEKTASEKAADKAAADAYQRSLGAIPDKGTNDPWGTVRSDTPKSPATKAAATKTTKAKTKTGSTDAKPPQ